MYERVRWLSETLDQSRRPYTGAQHFDSLVELRERMIDLIDGGLRRLGRLVVSTPAQDLTGVMLKARILFALAKRVQPSHPVPVILPFSTNVSRTGARMPKASCGRI